MAHSHSVGFVVVSFTAYHNAQVGWAYWEPGKKFMRK